MNQQTSLLINKKFINELEYNLKIFWICISIYCIGSALSIVWDGAAIRIVQLFQTVSILVLVYVCYQLIHAKVKNDFLATCLFFYFIWVIFILFHGLEYNYSNIKTIIFSQLPKYFFPLILLIPKNLKFYSRLFNITLFFAIIYIVLVANYLDIILTHYEINVKEKFVFEVFTQELSIPAGFSLLLYAYNKKIKNIGLIIAVIITLLIGIYNARRAISLFSAINLIVFGIILFINTNKKPLVVLVSMLLFVIIGVYAQDFIRQSKDSFLQKLMERGTTDTRSGVEEAFKKDFNQVDWIIGRGINGRYWCPNIDINDSTGYRSMIETDYLNIILKGGIIQLALILIIAIPAAWLALFKSKNQYSKVAGIWIILWILSLYPLNVYNADLNYLIFWICIGIGYSNDFRNLSDRKIINAFNE
ncbi:oligosaccharide repeat unit polymerase [Pleomorphovibrio marinus]|uniref:oligosaccharide repeat unit polymerase n=1 Tax=Pleomorphovibrio marinus TaxID=2164132 RepID=UPI000E0CBC14|nr:oligosaccharide repeat unit polymerase [Pleomorphovibrio marinus]